MSCFKCSLKSECKEPCEDVIKLVGEDPKIVEKRERYYPKVVTSFSELEEKSSSMHSNSDEKDDSGFEDWIMHIAAIHEQKTSEDTQKNRSEEYKIYLPFIKKVISRQATKKQQKVFKLWAFEEKSFAEIGEQLGISYQAVQQTIHGHSKHGGGLLRKIHKELSKKYPHYRR